MKPTLTSRGTDERLFDGGDSLVDDDTMRANWAVPWSDLMMTMFVLFAALLAAQTMRARAEQVKHAQKIEKQVQLQPQPVPVEKPVVVETPVPQPDKTLDELTQVNVLAQSNDAVRESNLAGVEVALMDDQSVKVSVQGPMFFAAGSADLRPEVTAFLARLAKVIRATPYDVHIVGHTDDRAIKTGLYPTNWELSLVRASRVARHLIDTGGIDPARFSVMGRGEYAPAHANTDAASRALNRRVEIIITRKTGGTP